MDPSKRATALGIVSVTAVVSFGLLAAAVARRRTAPIDEAVHERTAPPPEHPVRRVAEAMSPLGKWWTYIPAGAAVGAYLLAASPRDERMNGGRLAGAGAILLAGVAATALDPVFDKWLPQRPAPPGHRSPWKPVFPSGHAFGPAAVGLAAAYVLNREEMARARLTLPIALTIPLALSGSRVLLEKHWISDVLGGYLAAAAVAAASLVTYETARGGRERVAGSSEQVAGSS